jgi:hypothetical protein
VAIFWRYLPSGSYPDRVSRDYSPRAFVVAAASSSLPSLRGFRTLSPGMWREGEVTISFPAPFGATAFDWSRNGTASYKSCWLAGSVAGDSGPNGPIRPESVHSKVGNSISGNDMRNNQGPAKTPFRILIALALTMNLWTGLSLGQEKPAQAHPEAVQEAQARYEIVAQGLLANPTFAIDLKSAPIRLEIRDLIIGQERLDEFLHLRGRAWSYEEAGFGAPDPNSYAAGRIDGPVYLEV